MLEIAKEALETYTVSGVHTSDGVRSGFHSFVIGIQGSTRCRIMVLCTVDRSAAGNRDFKKFGVKACADHTTSNLRCLFSPYLLRRQHGVGRSFGEEELLTVSSNSTKASGEVWTHLP